MSLLNTIAFVTVSGGIWLVYKVSRVGMRDSDLPPGPPTIPLLGNLHVFPQGHIYLKFTEWAKQYGEIFSLKIGPGTAVVITSVEAVREIMDKNSAYTSDRPPLYMADIISGGSNLVFSRYNDTWRKLRRGAHEILTAEACDRHLAIQQAEATQLMHDLFSRPEDFFNSIRRFSSSVIFSIVFGKRAPQFSSYEVSAFYHAQYYFEKVLEPGAHPPVDLIPILKYVPEMFASWKTLCKESRRLQRALYFGLLDGVEHRMATQDLNGCFMETVCERAAEWSLNREMVAFLGGVLVDAGSDTTSGFMQSLILALVAHPEVQKKAQREIDELIGSDRAPILEDVENLPYVQAVIKETHRFRPVGPLAVPHATTADVMYKGYRIPAGTTIFVNNWGMFHDEDVYENESVFNPDRYLKTKFGTREEVIKDYKNWKEDLGFGSGRRVCPGIHLAKNSIAINAVNLLWGFNFGKAKDPMTGLEVEPDVWNYGKGISAAPLPFECTITPRSSRHKNIIEQEFANATNSFLPFEHELSEEDRKFVQEQRSKL